MPALQSFPINIMQPPFILDLSDIKTTVMSVSRINSPLQLCKSDQQSGIALVFAVLAQRKFGKHSGVAVQKSR